MISSSNNDDPEKTRAEFFCTSAAVTDASEIPLGASVISRIWEEYPENIRLPPIVASTVTTADYVTVLSTF